MSLATRRMGFRTFFLFNFREADSDLFNKNLHTSILISRLASGPIGVLDREVQTATRWRIEFFDSRDRALIGQSL